MYLDKEEVVLLIIVALSFLAITVAFIDTAFIYPDAAHQAVSICEDKYNTSIVTNFDRKPFTKTPLGVQCLTADVQVRGLESLFQ